MNGAEGAQIDPLTGDFLFSTFGANDRLLVVQGFNAPVPVELSSFTGRILANKVILNWTTQTENNNLGFEIERSENEIDFQKIGFVEGKVTTTWPEQYIFEDQNLEPGSYIYRLKQIDLDGAFEYSDLLYITVSPPRAFSVLQNYPNPFNPETTIRYDLPVASRVVVKIYSILGKEVNTLVNAEQTAGFKSVVWDGRNEAGNHMSSGVYIYRISAGKSTETHKLLLVR